MGNKVAVGEVLPLALRFSNISIIPPILHTHSVVIDTKEPHQLTALLTPTKIITVTKHHINAYSILLAK
jgi:hypothetical protein